MEEVLTIEDAQKIVDRWTTQEGIVTTYTIVRVSGTRTSGIAWYDTHIGERSLIIENGEVVAAQG